jgi:hypothetical protein
MNMKKGHWKALIIELDNPNHAKVGANMTDLEGNKFDVPGATRKGLDYIYFGATKFLPILKRYFISLLEVKKRRCRYVIYNRIDAISYYGN